MSDNPFAEPPRASNPYAAPANVETSSSLDNSNPLIAPAILLLVMSLVTLLLLLATLPGQVLRFRQLDLSTPEGQGELVGGIVALAGWLLITLAIIVGSINMLRLKSYRSAWHASLVALIPVCSPCFVLGIPVGIWALVLLRKPEVKAKFR